METNQMTTWSYGTTWTNMTTVITSWEEITETYTEITNISDDPSINWREVLISIILWAMCIVTAVGNALVIGVFAHDRRVRNKVSNLYILNLCVADSFVGFVSLPMNYFYWLTGIWPFGEFGCKVWLLVDFTACFVSVYAIVLISYDRYLLVTKGLEYDKCQTRRTFAMHVAITWLISVFRYFWMFVGYDLFNEKSIDYSVTCDNQVFYFLPYIVVDWIVTFFVPVCLTVFFNVKLYADIKRRSRGLPRNWASVTPAAAARLAPAEDTQSSSHTPSQEQPHTSSSHTSHVSQTSQLQELRNQKQEHHNNQQPEQVTEFNNNHHEKQLEVQPCQETVNSPKHVIFSQDGKSNQQETKTPKQQQNNTTRQQQPPSNAAPKRPRREGTSDIRKHRRTAITLGVIVAGSAACWAPYFVYVFLNFAFKVEVSIKFVTVSYYIWWGNSTLNPFLYVATNPGIRNGIAKILRIKR